MVRKSVASQILPEIHKSLFPLERNTKRCNFRPILNAIGDATCVMIGEASHGTDEFYNHRAEITKHLIEEKGFNIICVEADWPDCIKITNFLKGFDHSFASSAQDSLSDFHRFPRWMWRNSEVVHFLEWLKSHNTKIETELDRIGFYGLDLYSFNQSREELIHFLDRTDPEIAKKVRSYYSCFDESGLSMKRYGFGVSSGLQRSCEKECIKVLADMVVKLRSMFQQREDALLKKQEKQEEETILEAERQFYAAMNAKVVRDAEKYYREMYMPDYEDDEDDEKTMKKRDSTWNIRDKHMTDVLFDLISYWNKCHPRGPPAKAVIWAHNSHLGDASATEREKKSDINIGQLVRERMGLEKTFNIGFSTFHGTVTAAHNWDEPPHFMHVNDALGTSTENVFHQVAEEYHVKNFGLLFRSNSSSATSDSNLVNRKVVQFFNENELLQRAIGVVYRPRTERASHYFYTKLAKQFDAVIHLDKTRALHPLERTPQWEKGAMDIGETYPTGL